MCAYRILSLDGGGIRGLLTACLLERLESLLPGFLKQVDLFAGTSTGGVLVLGLASGISPGEARQRYEQCGRAVFQDSLIDDLLDLGQLIGAQYSHDPLEHLLVEQFGAATLEDLPKRVLIASFDLDNQKLAPGQVRTWKAKFFHNFPGEDSDGQEQIVNIALRTAAAPTFFPICQGFVDGGVIANNPAMCALAQALHASTGGQALADVRLLSLGTGLNPKFLSCMDGDWGLAQWAPHLLNLLLEGSQELVDYQCRQILQDRYLRLNPVLPVPIRLDSLEQVGLLNTIAGQFDLGPVVQWLDEVYLT
jgi:patatin-like phospholipase/acyl hydrolase